MMIDTPQNPRPPWLPSPSSSVSAANGTRTRPRSRQQEMIEYEYEHEHEYEDEYEMGDEAEIAVNHSDPSLNRAPGSRSAAFFRSRLFTPTSYSEGVALLPPLMERYTSRDFQTPSCHHYTNAHDREL